MSVPGPVPTLARVRSEGLTCEEAGQRFGCDPKALRAMVNRQEIPAWALASRSYRPLVLPEDVAAAVRGELPSSGSAGGVADTRSPLEVLRTRMTYRRAARLVGVGPFEVRGLIEAGKLKAWRDGGSDERPRLLVLLADVEEAVLARRRYIPSPPRAPRRGPILIHPRVRF